MVTVAFIWCFSCFNWFSYCRGKCICAGQGNAVVSHFVFQRAVLTVAIVCVPCGLCRSLIYACEWGFWVCWKLSAAEQIKHDCCCTPAVVSILLTPLPVSCPTSPPLHYKTIYGLKKKKWVAKRQGHHNLEFHIVHLLAPAPQTQTATAHFSADNLNCVLW